LLFSKTSSFTLLGWSCTWRTRYSSPWGWPLGIYKWTPWSVWMQW